MKLKIVLKTLSLNAFFLIFFLLVSEIFFSFQQPLSFTDKVLKIQKYWKPPISHMALFDNPFYATFIGHPFWGYVLNPNYNGANNLGFDNSEDFPVTNKSDEFAVGLFGGSVAESLWHYISAQKKEYFVNVCGIRKKIKITNYSLGGFKQPQQFNTFTTFMENIEMSINLDGTNEITFDPGLKYPAYYPVLFGDIFLINNEKLYELTRRFNLRKMQYHLLSFLTSNEWLLHSNLIYLTTTSTINFIMQYTSVQNSTNIQDNNLYEIENNRIYERFQNWKKYTELQSKVAKINGIRALFIVQPTQYLPHSKKLTEWEKKYAVIQNNNIELHNRERAYRILEEGIASIKNKNKNINLINFLYLFSKTEESIFIDDICHINDLGNEILLKAVMKEIYLEIGRIHCA